MESIKERSVHIPVLDGIRGLAIILVLFAHFVPEGFFLKHFSFAGIIFTKLSLMGLTGVSLFFVLSGFLITGILLSTKSGENYFRNFYARRILRIFPLYFLCLFLIFNVLPCLIDFSSQSVLLQNRQIWLWTYMSNFPSVAGIWNISDQFALGHFWSLSVEEHFYLLWPLIVFIVDLNKLKWICIITIFLSLVLGISSSITQTDYLLSTFLGWTTFTFSGALALGALLAIYKKELGSLSGLKNISKYLLWIFGILFFVIGLTPRRINPDLRGILAHQISWFFYAGLMIAILNMDSTRVMYKVFTTKLLVFFGKISYGIYVFHGILMPFFEKHIDLELINNITGSPLLSLLYYYTVTIGIVFVISWLSWIFLENQLLKLKRFF